VQGERSVESGSTAIKGWKVTNQLSIIGAWWPAADGNRSLFLAGPPANGGIAQTFKTTKGQHYLLTFSLASNPNGGRWPRELSSTRLAVSAAGKTEEFSFDSTGKTACDMGWVTKKWEFDAVADETTLEFRMLKMSDDFWHGPALDDVRVWAVPRKK
jgi:choice-of-anchor C domain-containing protein